MHYQILLFRVINVRRERNPEEHAFDVAIIEIADQFELTGTSLARAVVLPLASDINFNSSSRFTVSGWGRLRLNRPKPNKLHYVNIPWISEQDCRRNYGSSITSTVLCAGDFTNGGVDSCIGDSGGLCENEFYLNLIGVIIYIYCRAFDLA